MNRPLLSIITPVYNVEPYITECLESILAQNFRNFEVLLVNDGSTDNSGKICDEYAVRDPRFKVIHKPNGGVSSARNAALEISKGKYLTMLDPDDSVAPDTYENVLYLEQHPEIDILQFPYVNCHEDGQIEKLLIKSQTIRGKENILANWWEGNVLHFANLNKIFRAEIFHNLRYREGHLSEDTYLIADFVEKARQVFISEQGQYFYKIRNNSLSASYNFNKHIDLYEAHFRTYKVLYQYASLKPARVKAFNRLFRRLIAAQISTPEANITSYLNELKSYIPTWTDLRTNTEKSLNPWISCAKITGLNTFVKAFCRYLSIKKQHQ